MKSKTREEIEAECEAACQPHWDVFDAVCGPLRRKTEAAVARLWVKHALACQVHVDICAEARRPHENKRDAALVELDAAERAAAEKGTP